MNGLLQAVYDDPEADGPRQVYADWLLERGDPRGELIQLQLARPEGHEARVRELLSTHRREWLGPLAPHVIGRTVRFERGFPAAIEWRTPTPGSIRQLIGDPIWGTIREITFVDNAVRSGWDSPPHPAVALLGHPIMRALRAVRGTNDAVIVALAAGPPLPIVELGFHVEHYWPDRAREVIRQAPGLPYVHDVTLTLLSTDSPLERWLLESPIFHRVKSLVIGLWDPLHLVNGLDDTPLARVELYPYCAFWQSHRTRPHLRYVLTRGDDGRLSALESSPTLDVEGLVADLENIDANRLSSVIVNLRAGSDLEPVRRALARFRRAEVIVAS